MPSGPHTLWNSGPISLVFPQGLVVAAGPWCPWLVAAPLLCLPPLSLGIHLLFWWPLPLPVRTLSYWAVVHPGDFIITWLHFQVRSHSWISLVRSSTNFSGGNKFNLCSCIFFILGWAPKCFAENSTGIPPGIWHKGCVWFLSLDISFMRQKFFHMHHP